MRQRAAAPGALIVGLLASAVLSCAQTGSPTSPQTAPVNTGTNGPSTPVPSPTQSGAVTPNSLITPGDAVARSIIDASQNPAPPIVFLQPPPGPTITQWVDAQFWNNIGDPAAQFWSNLKAGVEDNPAGAIASGVSALLSVGAALTFEPGAVSLSSEFLGDSWTDAANGFQNIQTEPAYVAGAPESFKVPNFGISPSLISGGLTDSLPASTLSDAFGGAAVDFATAAGNGSNVGPVVYNTLSAAKAVNDIAEQGAKTSEPQVIPVDPVPSFSPSQSSPLGNTPSSQIGDILQRARQRQTDLSTAEKAAQQANADLDTQLTSAQTLAQTISAQQVKGLSITVPAGWVPCTCPDQHPGAGVIVNGVQYHTPLLHCSN